MDGQGFQYDVAPGFQRHSHSHNGGIISKVVYKLWFKRENDSVRSVHQKVRAHVSS